MGQATPEGNSSLLGVDTRKICNLEWSAIILKHFVVEYYKRQFYC